LSEEGVKEGRRVKKGRKKGYKELSEEKEKGLQRIE